MPLSSVLRVPCPASMAHILDNTTRRDFKVVDFLQFGVGGMIKAVACRKDSGEYFLVSMAPADRAAFSERLKTSFRKFRVIPPPHAHQFSCTRRRRIQAWPCAEPHARTGLEWVLDPLWTHSCVSARI